MDARVTYDVNVRERILVDRHVGVWIQNPKGEGGGSKVPVKGDRRKVEGSLVGDRDEVNKEETRGY